MGDDATISPWLDLSTPPGPPWNSLNCRTCLTAVPYELYLVKLVYLLCTRRGCCVIKKRSCNLPAFYPEPRKTLHLNWCAHIWD